MKTPHDLSFSERYGGEPDPQPTSYATGYERGDSWEPPTLPHLVPDSLKRYKPPSPKQTAIARGAAHVMAPAVDAGPHLLVRRASDIPAETVRWLWPGRVPYAMITMLDGDPGLGKSGIALDLAARLSRGRTYPNGGPVGTASTVVYVAGENVPGITLVPRLKAAGADLDRVHFVEGIEVADGEGRLTFPGALPLLTELALKEAATLIVIDPIMAFVARGGGHQQ